MRKEILQKQCLITFIKTKINQNRKRSVFIRKCSLACIDFHDNSTTFQREKKTDNVLALCTTFINKMWTRCGFSATSPQLSFSLLLLMFDVNANNVACVCARVCVTNLSNIMHSRTVMSNDDRCLSACLDLPSIYAAYLIPYL